MGVCECTCAILLISKSDKYPSVFRTIYKQERNDKWAFYNDRQLEYYFREGKDLRFEDTSD